jgi:hypothetical protein
MKKDTKVYLTLVIIIILIIIGIFWIRNNGEVSKELAQCIGERSELYVQLGCKACKTQEEMFGKNYQYLNTIDCLYERQECINAGILGTPTWIINGEKYSGVKSIERLKELTGC